MTSPSAPPLRLFISHSHQDKELASALHALLAEVFGNEIELDYSSDDAPGGGIRAGGTWLEWIMTTVRHTDVCLVILTEDSASAPWVTWETGAVTGVAIGSEAPSDRTAPTIRVVPITFGIGTARVPAPLQYQQAVPGDTEIGARKLLFMLQERCGVARARTVDDTQASVSKFVADIRTSMERRRRERPVRLQVADATAVHLLNGRRGLTLQPRGGAIADGARLECGQFTGDPHQRWLLYPVGANVYRISTMDSSKCLSIENDSKKSGAAVILWDYVEEPTQHWRVTSPFGAGGGPGTVSLVNHSSGHLLSSAADTNDVIQARRANVTNEDWWMLVAGSIE